MNVIANIGHNAPPDPIDDALSPYGDAITEAESWLDGSAVENEGQMKAVDSLLKSIKAAKKAVSDAEESAAKPIYDEWKAEKAKFAPTLTDLDRIAKGLVSIVDGFKRRLAAEREAERKEAARLAFEKSRAAEIAARAASVSDIDAQRAAAAAMAEAEAAQKAANAAKANTIKGLRWFDMHEVISRRAALHWIAENDPAALDAFIDGYCAKHAARFPADIVRVYKEQRAV